MEKRDNAMIWENKTTGCYKFQCDFDNGPVYWNQCNETDKVCENDQCVVKEEIPLYVEIEVDGIDVTDFSMTEIRTTISDLTSVEDDKLRIRVETNENNEIRRVVVIVDDKETAEIISTKINSVIDEGWCQDIRSSSQSVET